MRTALRVFFFLAGSVSLVAAFDAMVNPTEDPHYWWSRYVMIPMLIAPGVVWFFAWKKLAKQISEPTLRGAWLLAMVYFTFPTTLVDNIPLLPVYWICLGVPLTQLFYQRKLRKFANSA